MLIHLRDDPKSYQMESIAPYQRNAWELMLVFSQPLILTQKDGEVKKIKNTLIILPPQSVHGWHSEEALLIQRIVFHFTFLPLALEKIFESKTVGFQEFPLTSQEREFLIAQKNLIKQDFLHATNISFLKFEKFCLELSILCLLKFPIRESKDHLISKALSWYKEHLSECIGVFEVAQASGVSIEKLRRRFYRVLGKSPKEVFKKIQLDRSQTLLRESTESIEQTATLCGFTDPSSFWRFFKKETNTSPGQWRRKGRQDPLA